MYRGGQKMSELIDGVMGLAVGDALGVPVEFVSRKVLSKNPVLGMREYGTHFQPQGTWSDDTSLTLCLADSLKEGINYENIMKKFVDWRLYGAYTPYGKVFDIGVSTSKAILNYTRGIEAVLCGGDSEHDNGNGSLMRILPISYWLVKKEREEGENLKKEIEIIHNVSSLTHRHKRSLIACGIYGMIAKEIIKGKAAMRTAIEKGIQIAESIYSSQENFSAEFMHYNKLLKLDTFLNLDEKYIKSTGYVVHTLEASIWCLLNTNSYAEAVLKAVNLGDDSDTVGAVTGGLAGAYYHLEAIPKEWINVIAKKDYLIELCK